jgi:hypothetical protein
LNRSLSIRLSRCDSARDFLCCINWPDLIRVDYEERFWESRKVKAALALDRSIQVGICEFAEAGAVSFAETLEDGVTRTDEFNEVNSASATIDRLAQIFDQRRIDARFRMKCEDEALICCGSLFKRSTPNRSAQFVERRSAKGEQAFGGIDCEMIVKQR